MENALEELVEELQAENSQLRKENEQLRQELQDLKVRNAEIENRPQQLIVSPESEARVHTQSKVERQETLVDNKGSSQGFAQKDSAGVVVGLQSESNEFKGESVKYPNGPENCKTAESEQEEKNRNLGQGMKSFGSCLLADIHNGSCGGFVASGHNLSADAIRRYSRQLLVPSFGVAGQERLLKSSVLVVGCGGLGSPIALYLAASGVGCLGLVDNDVVELSNLHRQVIHTEDFVGKSKVESAASACRRLNSSVKVVEYGDGLNAANAVDIISKYHVILDATDNLPTRYLLSDACVVTKKPLVSGAALGVEGQLSVYNHNNGPCYRCLFPTPPPQGARQRCSDNGVIGVVPGIIGTFQALEALKLAVGVGEILSSRMLILDAFASRIHMVKLRGRHVQCIACGDAPQITRLNLHLYDYEGFTDSPLSDEAPKRQHIIPESKRISSKELERCMTSGQTHVLLDVRDVHEYAIMALPNSINIPLSSLKDKLQMLKTALTSLSLEGDSTKSVPVGQQSTSDMLTINSDVFDSDLNSVPPLGREPPIYVVCRRGNDSQRAVQLLRNEGFATAVDVIGGLESWVKNVNKELPLY